MRRPPSPEYINKTLKAPFVAIIDDFLDSSLASLNYLNFIEEALKSEGHLSEKSMEKRRAPPASICDVNGIKN